jgi:CheY-like chemotaxis protein
MKHILLVDDDPTILKLYQGRLTQLGLQVETAVDGLTAIQALHTHKPDLVVLDLMMPRFSGVDVLKFIRSEAKLKDLPVVVLSNSYMGDLAAEAASLGVQKALLKIRCSPTTLIEVINDVLAGKSSTSDSSPLLAAPTHSPAAPPKPAPPKPAPAAAHQEAGAATAEFQTNARRSFLQNASATCIELRRLCDAFTTAQKESERDLRLQDLCRKVHFVAAVAALAECHHIAQMASALEAMLFELRAVPAAATPSVLRTITGAVDFLALLFDHARNAAIELPLSAQALVVDDDAVNNRLVAAALQRAQVQVRVTQDPAQGLEWLQKSRFDLILLDIEMPVIDGFEFYQRLRKLPGYETTGVIFVTGHTDFASRAKSALSGGDDLIAKPIFPMELAVKAVAHLLKRQITAGSDGHTRQAAA